MTVQGELISARGVGRVYTLAGELVHAVRDIDLDINEGRFVALVGRSGSGKTTLLNLLAGLDRPTTGQVLFQGKDLAHLGEKQMVDLRRHRVGFVFQSFGLLPLLSAYENVELPLRIAGIDARARATRTQEVLEMVGLARRARHRPYELSGGEQQRIAIARAVALKPAVILADEPTGELDSVNAHAIFSLFQKMVHDDRMSIVATTHDQTLLDLADEVYEMHDGQITALRGPGAGSPDDMFKPPAARAGARAG
ncbi:MAG: ABC transporter ATP-binding protein [SAR202 cluster bacterium]|nr:ABC transporter ATP-binding protein [SAR202 cluster bacterium]